MRPAIEAQERDNNFYFIADYHSLTSVFDAEARRPDPQRMVRGYNQAAATLNLLRAFAKGGFADLSRVHAWNLEYVDASPEGRRYDALANEIDRALRFMAACGIDLGSEHQLHEVDFYTSHEALVLGYEEAPPNVQNKLRSAWKPREEE